MYRMDHAYKRHRYWLPAGQELSKLPSEYFAENVFVTFQDDWTAFKHADDMNWHHLLWANDFPHSDSTWPWSQEMLAEHTASLSDDQTDAILAGHVTSSIESTPLRSCERRVADPPVKSFATAAFETWLSRNHGKTEGIWLVIAKKGSGIRSVTYAEAVEVALCYGWIDGQGKKLDDERYVQKFTPRRARSPWSQINRKRVLALIEEGRMREPGLREIERAKTDGRWDAAYASPRAATVPHDLAKALRRDKKATAAFAALDSRNRYAILYRVNDAKKPETRERRITQFVEMLREGRKPYP
jgi:uncharacterized protein YdeI (YjbR/CyaY-like superfamily)